MPLDPSLIVPNAGVLSAIASPQPIASPLELQRQQLALQTARQNVQTGALNLQQSQLAMQQQQQAIQAFHDSGGDPQKAINTLMQQGNPLAFKLQETANTVQEGLDKHNKALSDLRDQRTKAVGNLARTVLDAPDDTSRAILYRSGLNTAEMAAPGSTQGMPQTYTPDILPQLQTAAGVAETPEQRKALAQAGEAQQKTIVGQVADVQNTLAKATSDAEFKQSLNDLEARGVPKYMTAPYRMQTWTPQLGQQLGQQAMTEEQRIAAVGQRADNARKEIQNAVGPLQRAVGNPDTYRQVYNSLSPDAQKIAPSPESNPTAADVMRASMTPKDQAELAIRREEVGLRQQELGIQAVRAKAETAIAQLNQADRETKVMGAPFQTALTGAQNQLTRLNEARNMLLTATPEAQALAVPGILSSIVGGQGTGVRVTQAEQNAILQARGIVGDMQAWAQKLTGTGKLTPDQRQQLLGVLSDVEALVSRKMDTATQSLQAVENAPDRPSRIAAVQQGRGALNSLVSGGGAAAPAYKVGDTVMYQGKPHQVTAVDPQSGKLTLAP